jgi:type IV pilus assembly protein PilE
MPERNAMSRDGTQKGLTLIEILVAMIIVAIVAAIGYPIMADYLRKARRSEAKSALEDLALRQTRWRVNNTTYSVTLSSLTSLSPSITGSLPDEYYAYSITAADATSFTLEAAAKAGTSQEDDALRDGTDCSTLSMDQNQDGTPAACW